MLIDETTKIIVTPCGCKIEITVKYMKYIENPWEIEHTIVEECSHHTKYSGQLPIYLIDDPSNSPVPLG